MKFGLYCNRCSKELTHAEDVFWVRFSKKFPNKEAADDNDTLGIFPLCKDCKDLALEFVKPQRPEDMIYLTK